MNLPIGLDDWSNYAVEESILLAIDRQVATTGPMVNAKSTVPIPNVPPRNTPITSTEASMVIRTLPIGTPVDFCSPVIQPSLGPGPRLAVKYIELPIPTSTIPEEAIRIETKKLSD